MCKETVKDVGGVGRPVSSCGWPTVRGKNSLCYLTLRLGMGTMDGQHDSDDGEDDAQFA